MSILSRLLGIIHHRPKSGTSSEDERRFRQGTRSILDIQEVAEEPEFCVAAPLSEDVQKELYGTTQPTRLMIEQNMDFLEDVERGQAVYIVVYKDGKPEELFFAGYSFD